MRRSVARILHPVTAVLALACATPTHADYDVVDYFDPANAPVYYAASAGQNDFAIPWAFETNADIVVETTTDDITTDEFTWSTRTLTTHYTLTGAGGNSGTLSFTDTGCEAGSDDTEGCTAGTTVMIWRNVDPERTDDLGPSYVQEAVNRNFDRIQTHVQQNRNQLMRQALKLPIEDKDKDVTLEPMTPNDAGRSVMVNVNADGFGWGGIGGCLNCAPGECDGGDNDGDECFGDTDCPGGTCVFFEDCDYLSVADGTVVCESGDTCPSGCGDGGGGEPCLDCGPVGRCEGGDNDGNPCTDDSQCPGGGTCEFDDDVCFGGPGDGDACTDDADCPEGGVCRPNTGICFGGSTDGESCTNDADCTGLCTALACVGGPDAGEVCATNSDCTPVCVDPGDRCDGCVIPCGGDECGAGICAGGTRDGGICDTNADCLTGMCQEDYCGECGGFCATNGDCGDGCACDVDNVCLGGDNDGDPCTDDSDCPGGGVCAPEFVDEVCQGGTNDGDPCTDDADCPGGGTCSFPDEVGVRMTTIPATDSCVTVADGTSGAFIECSRVTIGPTGFVRNVAAIMFSGVVSTATGELIIWQYPPTTTQAERAAAGAWYEFPKRSPDNLTDVLSLPQEIQYSWIGTDRDYEVSGGRDVTAWSPMTYPVTAFVPGVPANSAFVRIYITEPIVCPDDWAGSYVKASVAATAETTVNLQKNNSTVGTAVLAISGTTATLATSSGATQYAAGDYLDIDFPASADATAANFSVSLKCYRSATDEVN
jgi:hypothetical protein